MPRAKQTASKPLPTNPEEKLVALLEELRDRERFWKLQTVAPYGWQLDYCNAFGEYKQLLAMTGNRCGKTYIGASIMAMHATGLYPEWYTGYKFDRPIKAWAAGVSTETTRDILQKELLGEPHNPDAFGTGMIPKEFIVNTVPRPGVPNGVQTILVKHVSGGFSEITLKSYEMSQDKFMGSAIDLIWLDEECPKSIFTQCITRTATTGGFTYLTFTPEHGLTEIVKDFMYELKARQFMIQATWEDAPHLNDEVKEQLLSVYTAAERAMRAEGVPTLGTGVVFPVAESKVIIDPFPIPPHWFKVVGIDLGFDHPNAVACVAWDQETDTIYLYDEYSERGETISMHAAAIRDRGGDHIPVIVPHDCFKHETQSGKLFVDLYANHGLNIIRQPFTNPLGADGKPTGRNVEFGVNWMLAKMETGKFKVFSTCRKFLQEMKIYHREDGKIIDRNDDVISAVRYASLSIARFGVPAVISRHNSYNSYGNDLPRITQGIV